MRYKKGKTITPSVKEKQGKTTHYRRFDPSRTEIQDFATHLKHPNGGFQPEVETSRIVTNVNNFLLS